MKTTKQQSKIKFPKAAVGTFVNGNGIRIWIFARRGESVKAAIQRVSSRHAVSVDDVELPGGGL